MEAVPKKPADKPAHKKPAVKPHVARKPRAAKEHPEPAVVAKTLFEPDADAVADKPVVKIAHGKSFYAVGRRKTAVAQALLSAGNGTITINQLPFEGYFQTADLQLIVTQPLRSLGLEKQFNVKSKIHGGGFPPQAE